MGIKVNNIADVTDANGIADIAEINGVTVPAGGIAIVQSASGTTADGSQAAVAQVLTNTVDVPTTITGTGNVNLTVQAAGFNGGVPLVVPCTVMVGNDASSSAGSIRSALNADATFAAFFAAVRVGDDVIVTFDSPANNDLTASFTVTPTTATGINASSSTITTPGNTAGLTVNFDVPVTAGNSVIALISCVNANEPTDLTGPTCVGGGAAGLSNAVGVAPSPNFQAIIFYLHNVAGGETGVTYSLQGDAGRASMQILEVSGLADAAAEATGTGSGNSTDVLIDGFSNTTPIALAVAIGAWNANNYNNGPADGWTRVGTGTGGANVWQESAYKILSVAEAQGTQWTLDPSADFAIAAAVFGAA